MEVEFSLTDVAYLDGWEDARNYNGCQPDAYEYGTKEESISYIEGYGDGADANLHYENGVCPPRKVLIASFTRN